MMKTKFFHLSSVIILFIWAISDGFAQNEAYSLLIRTSKGNIKCILYQETPMHTENFVELVKKGYYDGLLFHRVINDFMIQSGDSGSRNAEKGETLGYGSPDYKVPAEFHPALYHKRGAIGAARQGDKVNPSRQSNASQFYIVQGRIIPDAEMDALVATGAHIRFTDEQRRIYREQGGTPHLDYAYTIFGEVTGGMNIVDTIVNLPTDQSDRPLEDIKIISITLFE